MANTVIGLFENEADAQQAVSRLIEAGIEKSAIDVSKGNAGMSDLSGAKMENDNTESSTTQKGEHAGGAIAKFFHSLFHDDSEEAARYTKAADASNAIVTVHATSTEAAEDAADILDEAGAIDVNEKAAYYGHGTVGEGTAASAAATPMPSKEAQTEGKIDRIKEELQVGKRSVQTGGVRVRSRIIERPVQEELRLREEQVTVNRTAVNRTLSEGDYAAFQDQNIELTEYAEVPVVNKEARVVEEIRIGKEATERNEVIHDTVRETQVDIENIAGQTDATSRTADSDAIRKDTDNRL